MAVRPARRFLPMHIDLFSRHSIQAGGLTGGRARPEGVPVAMMSPGFESHELGQEGNGLGGGEDHVGGLES